LFLGEALIPAIKTDAGLVLEKTAAMFIFPSCQYGPAPVLQLFRNGDNGAGRFQQESDFHQKTLCSFRRNKNPLTGSVCYLSWGYCL
jgi:hypothetical protein